MKNFLEIQNELKELNSSLTKVEKRDLYSVPAGYFEALPAIVLNRIRALHAGSVNEELDQLSPFLNSISRQNPFTIPAGYFDNMIAEVMDKIKGVKQSADEELASLSPFLAGMKKKMPYSVPEDYFENVASHLTKENARTAAKLVPLTRRPVFKYAAAAVVTGLIALSGIFFLNKRSGGADKPIAQVVDMLQHVPDLQQDSLVEKFISPGNLQKNEVAQTGLPHIKSEDIKELLKDVSENELKDFQQQSEDIQDIMMAN